MIESLLNLATDAVVQTTLKRHGMHYKLKNIVADGKFAEVLHFFDTRKKIQVSGKIVKTFTEGEVYHWPLLSHENLAPLIDVIFIYDNLSIFITIDLETTLRFHLHEDDFVYDLRCYSRKKSYARGIFRGLSYLHDRSLCLMNLSDKNIIICRTTDQAIISDFSCLICSRRTTKSLLGVPDHYKAPESYNDEFDATAAEIWASGILMLEMFLSHMVPWAIADYKPKKILKLVDKISYELLKSANIGSLINNADLGHFKIFLKCFFKDNPMARVTAKNASIASFLSRERLNTIGFGTSEETIYLNEIKEHQKPYNPTVNVISSATSRNSLRKEEEKISSKNTSNSQMAIALYCKPTEKKSFITSNRHNVSETDNKEISLENQKPYTPTVNVISIATSRNALRKEEDKISSENTSNSQMAIPLHCKPTEKKSFTTSNRHNISETVYKEISLEKQAVTNTEYPLVRNLEPVRTKHINIRHKKSVLSDKYGSTEKLIAKNTYCNVTQERNSKRLKSKNGKKKSIKSTRTGAKRTAATGGRGKNSEAEKKTKKSADHPKKKEKRRLLFSCFHPSRTVEEPSAIPVHLCERCKLISQILDA